VGHFSPTYVEDKALTAGQIGYVVTGQKSVRDAKIGDTMLGDYSPKKNENLLPHAIPGFAVAKPFVFAGVYPISASDYPKLVKAMSKLSLNDSAISYEPESSAALGQGFRCGFLGTLHIDIVSERLKREFGMDTIFTLPTVTYLVRAKQYKSIEKITSGHNIKELIASGLYAHIVDTDPDDANLLQPQLVEKYTEVLISWILVHSGASTPEQ
jgi:GTP-binding protein LepA